MKTGRAASLGALCVDLGRNFPAEILRATTSDPAKLLRADRERGVIAEALVVDLITTPEDPLKDIMILRKVDFVMKDRRIVKGCARSFRGMSQNDAREIP